jgi:hypothetical protein
MGLFEEKAKPKKQKVSHHQHPSGELEDGENID